MSKKIIKYKNKILETNNWIEINLNKYLKIKKQYNEKPNFEEVIDEIIKINNGGTKNSAITKYYFKDIMNKVVCWGNKWSLEDVFNCKELVEHFYAKTLLNKKMYSSNNDLKNIEKAIQMGGNHQARKPTNFPIKTVDEILKKYNINNNWYDFSCGWGARLTGALKNKVNYYGTDPNYLLTKKLNQLANDYKNTVVQNTIVDIRTQGSEIFIPEWENKMGVAFSSPPYFNLEDYKIGNQSYKEGITYQQWLNNYLKPTIKNIYKYLIDDGIFLINIKNFNKLKLEEDTIKIAKEVGFNYIKSEELINIQRTYKYKSKHTNQEKIYVFAKKENIDIKNDNQLTIFDILESKGE